MQIKELIEKLSKLPDESELLFYHNKSGCSYSISFIDDKYANDGHYSRVYLESED